MPTAIVPAQAMLRHTRADAFVQNAFQILVGVVVARVSTTIEKAGRRHLPGVAGDNDLLATGNGSNGIPRRNLRGFVEDHQIEQLMVGRQILRDG